MSMPTARRTILKRAACFLGGSALIGACLAVLRSILDWRVEPPVGARGALGLVRPPGALAEERFLASCIRCTECFDACRPRAIRLFSSGNGTLTGTPYIVPEETACNLCLACGAACPSRALMPLAAMKDVRMGTAVVDERLCVSFNGTGVCGACHTICPLKNTAITQGYRNQPQVHPEFCVGCGLCEEACIVEDRKAIRVFTERKWRTVAS